MKSLLAVCVLALAIAGCEPVESGIVYKKEYRPPWTQVSFHHIGKMWMPYTVYHPERFRLYLRKDCADGKVRTGEVSTYAADYEKTQLGQFWPRRADSLER